MCWRSKRNTVARRFTAGVEMIPAIVGYTILFCLIPLWAPVAAVFLVWNELKDWGNTVEQHEGDN